MKNVLLLVQDDYGPEARLQVTLNLLQVTRQMLQTSSTLQVLVH